MVLPSLSRRLAVGAAAAFALVAVVVVLHHRAARAAPPAPTSAVPVTLGTVTRTSVPVRVTGTGTVQASQSVTVRTRVDGELQKVAFTEGDDVKRGQLLAQIDPRTFEATLASARAQKARDEATLAAARKDLERYKVLVAQDSIQQQTLDTQTATVAQLQAAVQADDAAIATAAVQLGYTSIRSPIDGRAGILLQDAGNIVHATDAAGLVVINQIDPIAVLFTLPEGDVTRVNAALRAAGRTPLPVTAESREDGSTLATGRLTLINNQIDTTSGTVQLKAQFANPQHTLWPGQYVNAILTLGTRADALTVPDTAVQRGPNGLYVYAVDNDGVAQPRPVTVVQRAGGVAVIGTGLEAGQKIVVDGQYKLRPGVHVTGLATPAHAAAAR
ncbi:MAG: efflux RND transporter periplasmic adaptor subunit [Proteobacteria bacterium]|nr:efflux RND transporter periplasmic adaptor subunit [Pseudomonadota bacterium]